MLETRCFPVCTETAFIALIRCCSTAIYKASVCPQHKPLSRLLITIVLFCILDISCLPVVRNIETKMKNMKQKEKAAPFWGPSFLLNSHLPCSRSGTGAHTRTRQELDWSNSPTPPKLHIVRMLSPQNVWVLFLFCFTDPLLFCHITY